MRQVSCEGGDDAACDYLPGHGSFSVHKLLLQLTDFPLDVFSNSLRLISIPFSICGGVNSLVRNQQIPCTARLLLWPLF